MAYYMNKNVPAKRGDIFYISNSKCYATDPSNTEGRPAIVVSSDKLNEHADVVEVVYLTTTALSQKPHTTFGLRGSAAKITESLC